MVQFGRVIWPARSMDCSFRNVFDGAIQLTILLHNKFTLSNFINIKDESGHLEERLFVFSRLLLVQPHWACRAILLCRRRGHWRRSVPVE
jgi:hypothetical protein